MPRNWKMLIFVLVTAASVAAGAAVRGREPALNPDCKLDAKREETAPFDRDGATWIDTIAFSDQTTDISFGRYPDGHDDLRFFGVPSFEVQNDGGYLGAVADVQFSHSRGFYRAPFFVTIATETEGAAIHYTRDGATPPTATGRSPTSAVYTGPILINTTTTLRAAAVKPGWKPTNVDTQTYIFLDDVLRQATNPATRGAVVPDGCPASWGSVAGDYQVDPDIVNHSIRDNRLVADDMMSVPTISLVMPRDDWFGSKGIYINQSQDGTERVASMEFIDPATGREFQLNCAIAMQGGVSGGGTSLDRWKTAKLSMRPRFKAATDDGTATGGPTTLNYKVFHDSPTKRFDTVVLDAVLNHSWLHPGSDQRDTAKYIQDQYVADLHNAMGGHSPHGFFAHLYISGLYWGMYYVHERPDHSWAAETFSGEKEEYDAIKHGPGDVVNDGAGGRAGTNYNNMVAAANAVQSQPANMARYETLCEQLDVDSFITYLLANWFCGNHDWPQKNWYATHRNHLDGRWRFHSWDAEHTVEGGNDVGKSPSDIHNKLKGNTEYRLRFADHVHRHFFNGGVLSYPNAANMYAARMAEIDRAIVGESARWGDNRKSVPYTRQDWLNFQNNSILNGFFPGRSTTVLGWLRSAGLYPNVEAPVFRINGAYRHGGLISKNGSFSMTAPAGTTWYTLDGLDPRMPGTSRSPVGVSPTAIRYAGPITLPHSAHVQARVLSGNTWSALNEAVYAVGPVAENLRITEIMYHPFAAADANDPNEEFIELTNIGAETIRVEGVPPSNRGQDARDTINLNLVRFTNGIDFTFPDIELTPGAYVVVVQDRSAFEARYGRNVHIAGQYAGRLSNAGERITLQDAVGQTILDFTYSDGWRSLTDGEGFSLTIIDPANPDTGSWDSPDAWRASAYAGGSPGYDDSGIIPNPGAVVINEVLTYPLAQDSDWIELYNTTGTTIDLSGWFLSDSGASRPQADKGNLFKYQIANGTTLAPYGYLVFYEDLHFGNANDPGCREPFGLSRNGESLYLSSARNGVLTGYREVEEFGASQAGVSFGRYYKVSTDSYNGASRPQAEFVAMEQNTPGSANAYPKVGPIVISEIMYHPDWPVGGLYTNDQYEYIELYNISSQSVTLYDYVTREPWKFTDGIEFTFPADVPVTIPAGGYLLIVQKPEAFTWRYPAVPAEQILGPYDGKLNNAGEAVELSMPGDVDNQGNRSYIRIERVTYSDGSAPADLWPPEADGQGQSLTRKVLTAYANDPDNWTAAPPSPGR